jgi:hypothetical protein
MDNASPRPRTEGKWDLISGSESDPAAIKNARTHGTASPAYYRSRAECRPFERRTLEHSAQHQAPQVSNLERSAIKASNDGARCGEGRK